MEKSVVIIYSSDMKMKSRDDVQVIAVNELVSVLTKKDGRLWRLDKDDMMAFCCKDRLHWHTWEVCESVWLGCMKDEIVQEVKRFEADGGMHYFDVPDDGMYCLCFLAEEMLQYVR